MSRHFSENMLLNNLRQHNYSQRVFYTTFPLRRFDRGVLKCVSDRRSVSIRNSIIRHKFLINSNSNSIEVTALRL